MDYGHPLQFGTFITPSNAQPEVPVALAQLSERARLRPGHVPGPPVSARLPRHLDAADLGRRPDRDASTSSANVLNIPLRPPAVLARAAASLDLLSGGRLELGLGAGGFWDAIEAMGSRRLTPGRVGGCAERGDRRHPRDLGGRRASAAAVRRRALPPPRRQARAGAGARDPDLARRAEAAHAAADRSQGRRLAAVVGLSASRGSSRPATRSSTRRRRPPAATPARSAAC